MIEVTRDRKFVTDWFIERFNNIIVDEFGDFQDENGIESGDLPPELEIQLDLIFDQFVGAMDDCMKWQYEHLR